MDTNLIKIAITFKGGLNKIGLTKFKGRLSSGIIQEFFPEPEHISRTIEELKESGFEITSQNDLCISARGEKRIFEKIFGMQLIKHSINSKFGIVPETEFYYPQEGSVWDLSSPLDDYIDDAYVQWPIIFTNNRFPNDGPSMYPPNVDFHHLRIPGDLNLTLNAVRTHREGITGKNVRVAMIDSGFNFSHPYFEESGYQTSVSLAPGATDIESDMIGHGTAMAANLLAVAPGVNFVGIKINNDKNNRENSTLIEAFDEALRFNPDIISMSLASDLAKSINGTRISDEHLTDLPNGLKGLEGSILNAIRKGVTVVCACGNGDVAFPGMMPEVISVGGVYVDSNGAMRVSDMSSAFQSKIYLGRNVPDFCGLTGLKNNDAMYIMLPFQPRSKLDRGGVDQTPGNDGWGILSGTSSATAQVAGVCALMLEKQPGLTPDELKSILRLTSRTVINGHANPESNEGIPWTASSGGKSASGAGLIDAFAAIQKI